MGHLEIITFPRQWWHFFLQNDQFTFLFCVLALLSIIGIQPQWFSEGESTSILVNSRAVLATSFNNLAVLLSAAITSSFSISSATILTFSPWSRAPAGKYMGFWSIHFTKVSPDKDVFGSKETELGILKDKIKIHGRLNHRLNWFCLCMSACKFWT